jgi:hypothetical protein
MLRLYNPVARAPIEIRPGPLRIHVHDADPRVHVTADLLRRVAERRGHQVLVGHSGTVPDWDPAQLNVQAMDWPPGDADLHIAAAPGGDAPPERFVVVASSLPSWADADPLSVRLAMLSTHYRTPIATPRADERLGHWRDLVAEWAGSPGRPMCADYMTEATAALDDDLDTPAVLSLMDRLAADPEIPPGAKFETFVHLDLILALDLVSAIGRPR